MAESGFFRELRRRHIVRVAVAYALTAWLLLQLGAIVFPVLHAPAWCEAVLLAFLVLGFPVALLLAWAFELTPEGVRRTIPADAEAASMLEHGRRVGRTLDFAIIAILAGAVGVLAWRLDTKLKPASSIAAATATAPVTVDRAATAVTTAPDKSIAVLPFVNDSGDPGQQYFSDGLSEDLITALSKFAGLKVISRNSSFVFRDTSDDAKTIGAKLDVAHLLEGSVRRDGQTVRITAELVSVPDGSAQWSQHYDRPYRNLFQLQDDITQAIADALKAHLLRTTDEAIHAMRPPSGSLSAYDAWLQANFYAQGLKESDLRRAITEYGHAIALDPNYAQAYADRSYAWTHLAAIWLTGRTQQDAYAKARKDAHMALSLEPNLAAGHRSLGSAFKWGSLDIPRAAAEYRRAVLLAPNSAGPRIGLGLALASLGRLDEGTAQIRQAIRYDPLNSSSYRALADIELARGRFEDAERAIQKAIALRPDAATNRRSLVYLDIRRGDEAAALRDARQEPDPLYRQWELAMALQIGPDRAAADAALNRFVDRHAELAGYQIAEAYALRKEPSRAFAWLDRAWAVHDPGVMELRYDPFLLAYKDDPRFAAFCRKVGIPVPDSANLPAATTAQGR